MMERKSDFNTRHINPGYKHEERRGILSDIAILSGYDTNLKRGLPDGTIPDVLRIDSSCGSIFLGEAKDTESPGMLSTRKRLLNYLSWFRFIVGNCKGSLFVLCVGNKERWKCTLSGLVLDAGIKNSMISAEKIDNENYLITLRLD